MRHLSLVRTDTDVDRRFAKQDRFQLRVNIGDVDERDISEGFEFQQLVLRQALLSRQPRP